MITVKCHFDGKSLVLDEPVELPHDQPLIAVVTPQETRSGSSSERKKGLSSLQWMAANAIDDPALPADGSYQHDHYLYGTPKKP